MGLGHTLRVVLQVVMFKFAWFSNIIRVLHQILYVSNSLLLARLGLEFEEFH